VIVRELDKENRLFYVASAGWEVVMSSTSPEDAMARAIESLFDKFNKDFELAPTILALDLTTMSNGLEDLDNQCYIGYTPSILADAGQHELSRKYEQILRARGDL
jgi:hypothetical protein